MNCISINVGLDVWRIGGWGKGGEIKNMKLRRGREFLVAALLKEKRISVYKH